MELGHVFTDSLDTSNGKRPLDDEKVNVLMESIKELGLQQPIHVWATDDTSARIVAGRHRAEACRRLGWDEIPCVFVEMDEIEREMWEIAENLHRAELTALQRSEQIARWVELQKNRDARKGINTPQVVEKKKKGRKESGAAKAARDLGIKRGDAERSGKIATLSEPAKQAAQETGLDDNQSALLAASREESSEAQISVLQNWKVKKPVPPPDDPRNDGEAVNAQVQALVNAWNKAGPDARRMFLERIDKPVMDARYA